MREIPGHDFKQSYYSIPIGRITYSTSNFCVIRFRFPLGYDSIRREFGIDKRKKTGAFIFRDPCQTSTVVVTSQRGTRVYVDFSVIFQFGDFQRVRYLQKQTESIKGKKGRFETRANSVFMNKTIKRFWTETTDVCRYSLAADRPSNRRCVRVTRNDERISKKNRKRQRLIAVIVVVFFIQFFTRKIPITLVNRRKRFEMAFRHSPGLSRRQSRTNGGFGVGFIFSTFTN